jgi:chemotaxis protein CheX
MNVKFINPFLEGTISVLKTMAFVEPRAGKPYLKVDSLAKGDISGIIGLTGSATGSMALSFSEAAILKIVSNMLGEDYKSMNDSMISGVARKNLEADGFYIQSAIPTVVTGKNHSITHVMGGPSLIIPFEIDEGTFVVDVCLTE